MEEGGRGRFMTRGEFAMRNWILIGGCIQDFVYYETRVEFFTFSSCFFYFYFCAASVGSYKVSLSRVSPGSMVLVRSVSSGIGGWKKNIKYKAQ